MTKKSIAHTIIHTLEALAILVLSLLLFKACKKSENVIYIPVEVRDTITIEKERIVEHTKLKYMTKFDTIIQYISDSDTIQVPVEIPIENKTYQDTIRTDSTEIQIGIDYSGYKAEIDRIGINYHWIGERPVPVKKGRFGQFVGVGFGIGVSAGYNPFDKSASLVAPGFQVGIVYGFGYTW